MSLRHPKSVIERLFEKIAVHKSNDCWLWTGSSRGGYGRIKLGRKSNKFLTAHRAIFALTQGIDYWQAPEVIHSCDNPKCCNPKHLRAGTHQDNMDDMKTRGRRAPQAGSINGHAFLTDEQVAVIRNDSRTDRAIATEYGVTHQTISKVRSGKTWS